MQIRSDYEELHESDQGTWRRCRTGKMMTEAIVGVMKSERTLAAFYHTELIFITRLPIHSLACPGRFRGCTVCIPLYLDVKLEISTSCVYLRAELSGVSPQCRYLGMCEEPRLLNQPLDASV